MKRCPAGVMFRFLATSFVFFLWFYSGSTFCCVFEKKKENTGNLFLTQLLGSSDNEVSCL